MYKAIFYKEWIKTRWYLLAALAVGAMIMLVMFLKLGRSFRYAGHEHLWDVIVSRMQFMFTYIRFFPLLAGMGLGVAQMLPEILNARLKLSLHLPLTEKRVVGIMLGYSLLALLLMFGVLMAILILGAVHFFPMQITASVLYTVLPWFIAGFVGYLLLAFTLLEPTWKRKALNLALSFFILSTLFIRNHTLAYEQNLILQLITPAICILLAFYSVARYKIGVQAS